MINLFKAVPTGEEIADINDVLEGGWWAMGPKVQEFEEKFAARVGAKYAIATNSCSAALDIAVRVVDLGDTVTVSPLTFVSSALAILNAGKRVKFVDVDEASLCSDVADIQVLYAGNDHGNGIIYDMAHSGGALHKGLVSCWSFQAVKNLPTGDGGMLTTNDPEIARRAKAISWCGIDKSTFDRSKKGYSWDYNIEEVGLKANMNDITAVIGLSQLKYLEERNAYRAKIASWYDAHLDKAIRRPYPSKTWHMYVLRLPDRDRLIDTLAQAGITAGMHYKPLYKYPIFPRTPLPTVEKVWKQLITLPLHVGLTEKDVQEVCTIVNAHVRNRR